MRLTKAKTLNTWFTSVLLITVMMMSACSSHISPEISQTLEGAPSISQVRDNVDAYLSQKVRWGGVILDIENKQNTSWLTIVAFPLNDRGRPSLSTASPGRFIAIVDEFLEPLVYNSDKEITITGKLLRTEIHKIDDFSYDYPVIKVAHYHLWSERPKIDPGYPPYWWYDPCYPPYYHWRPHSPRAYR